jgi:hypothetical protein
MMDSAQYAQYVLETYASGSNNNDGDEWTAPSSSSSLSIVDESLGAYVISLLQEDQQEGSGDGETNLPPDFEFREAALVELLQEHCNLSEALALEALDQIRHFVSRGRGAPSSFYASSTTSDGGVLNAVQSPASPLHEADILIPGDLLGVLDVNATPRHLMHQPAGEIDMVRSTAAAVEPSFQSSSEDAFPPLHVAVAHSVLSSSTSKKSKAPRARKTQASITSTISAAAPSDTAVEVAAALFRPRSRQNSVDESAQSALASQQLDILPSHLQVAYDSMPFEAAMEMILSMNPDLSEEAATAACAVAHNDVNLAQYLVEQALAAPAVCRHLLSSGCYRADCQFSHNIENHTCLFWMKGRCREGSSCKFKHDFNETLLHQLFSDASIGTNPAPNPLCTHPNEYMVRPSDSRTKTVPPAAWGSQASSTSFASVAKGQWQTPDETLSRGGGGIASRGSSSGTAPTIKIPTDVWTPHESRDSSVFHIADPMSRYERVQAGLRRDDVVDLHFQSTKTFPVVLSTALPEKLAKFPQVWVVTGTGHHVGTRTHQKGGGALESAVVEWLQQEGYSFLRGRDRNGQGGAICVERA